MLTSLDMSVRQQQEQAVDEAREHWVSGGGWGQNLTIPPQAGGGKQSRAEPRRATRAPCRHGTAQHGHGDGMPAEPRQGGMSGIS